ncbi:MAG: hypothetical protein WC707_04385 [Candidatus Babeliaceae bacterium]|jgi:hypothetical protein
MIKNTIMFVVITALPFTTICTGLTSTRNSITAEDSKNDVRSAKEQENARSKKEFDERWALEELRLSTIDQKRAKGAQLFECVTHHKSSSKDKSAKTALALVDTYEEILITCLDMNQIYFPYDPSDEYSATNRSHVMADEHVASLVFSGIDNAKCLKKIRHDIEQILISKPAFQYDAQVNKTNLVTLISKIRTTLLLREGYVFHDGSVTKIKANKRPKSMAPVVTLAGIDNQ